MRPFYPVTYIISAYNAQNCEATNLKAHENGRKYLLNDGFQVKDVSGCFKGVHEDSLIAIGGCDDQIIQFLKDFTQECALKLDGFRNAYFLFQDGTYKYAGQFKGTNCKETIIDKDYTFDPDSKTYYYLEK